jgi:hypothetical protein
MLNQFLESGLYFGRNDDFCIGKSLKVYACPQRDTGVGDYVS